MSEGVRSTSEDALSDPSSPRLLGMPVLSVVLVLVSVAVLGAWVLLAVVHIDDGYHVMHLQGVWMALSHYADEGVLYPPLYDGTHYGGTRWMPLPIVVNALAARVTGEYLVSGKVVAFALTAGVLTLLFVVLVREGCPWPIAAALTSTILTTEAGLQAGTAVGGDVLPVLIQLGAVTLVTRPGNSAIAGAGALSALAVVSKLSAVWALLATASWFVIGRKWDRLAVFAASFAVALSIGVGGAQLASGGRMLDNLATLAFAGVGGLGSAFRSPNQVLYNLEGFARGPWALMPLAALSLFLWKGWRRISVYQLALAWSLTILAVVYTDIGTGPNQTFDVIVLVLLVVGRLASDAVRGLDGGKTLLLLIAVTAIWVAASGLVLTLVPDVRSALGTLASGRAAVRDPAPMASFVKPGETLLSEDPYVAVSLGRKPVVLDAFMLPRLQRSHPQAVDDLVRRIKDRRFDIIVLIVPLEGKFDFWWRDYHFGSRVADTIRRGYVLDQTVGRYYVYRPRPHDS